MITLLDVNVELSSTVEIVTSGVVGSSVIVVVVVVSVVGATKVLGPGQVLTNGMHLQFGDPLHAKQFVSVTSWATLATNGQPTRKIEKKERKTNHDVVVNDAGNGGETPSKELEVKNLTNVGCERRKKGARHYAIESRLKRPISVGIDPENRLFETSLNIRHSTSI